MSAAKVKTLDGKRTGVQNLNTEIPPGLQSEPGGLLARIGRAWKNLNLILAGMYTGVGCSGTPHPDHSYQEAEEPPEKSKPRADSPAN